MRSDFGKRTEAGAAVVLMLALAGSPALAAPSTAGDDRGFADTGLTGVSPVTGRGYYISPSVRTVYDTNMLRLGDGLTPTNGGQRADFRISPLVSASVGMPIGRQQVFVVGSLGRDYYINNVQLNRNRYSLGAGANLRAGTRCTATAAVDFDSRQALVSELAELVPSVQESLSYGATALCQSAVGFGFGGTVRRVAVRNDSLIRSQLDLNSMLYSGQLSYAFGNIGRFNLSGNLSKVAYVNRPVLLVDGSIIDDGVEILSGSFGYQRELGSRLSVQLSLSYVESKPQPRTVVQLFNTVPPALPGLIAIPIDRETFSGLGYQASISYRPSARLSGTFQAARNVQASANVGAQFQVQTSLGADVSYRLGSAINVGTGVTLDKRQYFNGVRQAIPGAGTGRISDDISRVYGSVAYAPVKLYSLGLEVAYQTRKSTPVEFSFNSLSASLSLRINFGRGS